MENQVMSVTLVKALLIINAWSPESRAAAARARKAAMAGKKGSKKDALARLARLEHLMKVGRSKKYEQKRSKEYEAHKAVSSELSYPTGKLKEKTAAHQKSSSDLSHRQKRLDKLESEAADIIRKHGIKPWDKRPERKSK